MPRWSTPIVVDGKVIGRACGSGPLPKCRVCGKPRTKQCDFPLTGKKAGRTCDMNLCDTHATVVGKDRDYCPAHAEATRQEREDAARVEQVETERLDAAAADGGRWP